MYVLVQSLDILARLPGHPINSRSLLVFFFLVSVFAQTAVGASCGSVVSGSLLNGERSIDTNWYREDVWTNKWLLDAIFVLAEHCAQVWTHVFTLPVFDFGKFRFAGVSLSFCMQCWEMYSKDDPVSWCLAKWNTAWRTSSCWPC